MTFSEKKFDLLRARCKMAHEALHAALRANAVKYGSDRYGPQGAILKARSRREKAFGAMSSFLQASPRDWRAGVPFVWVCLDLTYADATRPLSEALSVVPPRAWGATHDMR